jgi:hypothetical protein
VSAAGDDANIDLSLQPKGTGNVTLGNFTFDGDATVGAGQDNYVLTYDDAGGVIGLEAAAGGSTTVFNASWEYDSTVTKADPGAGKFRLDNATMASVTEMYIDDLDKAGIDMGTWIDNFSDGHIRLGQSDSSTAGALFSIDGTATDETGYWTIPVSHIADGTGGLSNGKTYGFQFESGLADASSVLENIGFTEIKTDRDYEESSNNWRPIYIKSVDVGALPNATLNTTAHSISNLSQVVDIYGIGDDGTNQITIPRANPGAYTIDCYITSANINIDADIDVSSFNGIVTIEYTKTTDSTTSNPRSTTTGGGLSWNTIEKTSAYTAEQGDEVMCDTATTSAFTVTLPASPTNGTRVRVIDSASNWATANLTVGRNGNTIRGSAADLVCDVDDAWVELIWNNNDSDWDLMTP